MHQREGAELVRSGPWGERGDAGKALDIGRGSDVIASSPCMATRRNDTLRGGVRGALRAFSPAPKLATGSLHWGNAGTIPYCVLSSSRRSMVCHRPLPDRGLPLAIPPAE